jgi:ABC-type uncharacterized transport system auxiliary subunit
MNAARALIASLLLLCASCALTTKSESVFFRYYTLEKARPATPSVGPTGGAKLQLRLGNVSAASYLKDKIAFRVSANEIGFYEQLRWTEKPEAYLYRAVSRALFEEQQVQQLVGGAGPTLELELNVFEELRAPRHAARVELAWMIRDDNVVLIQRTLTVERPIAAASSNVEAGAVATAMSDALGEAIGTVVAGVVAELSRGETK